jgi:hypothetical protein
MLQDAMHRWSGGHCISNELDNLCGEIDLGSYKIGIKGGYMWKRMNNWFYCNQEHEGHGLCPQIDKIKTLLAYIMLILLFGLR